MGARPGAAHQRQLGRCRLIFLPCRDRAYSLVFRFPSLDKAQAFWNSPAYQEIVPIRQKASTGRIYMVEGLPQ